MAEVFGAVAGAISVTALFNECIDCFHYIQIARHFGQDFSRYQLRLDVARCRLSRWGAAANVNNDPRFMNNMLSDDATRLHNRFATLTLDRQNRVGLLKKASWALYDKEYMGRMIEDIATSINELERVFPVAPQTMQRLATMEIEELNDEQELKMLQDVTKGLDPVLKDMTEHRLQELTGKNSAGRVAGNGSVNIGHTFVKESFVQAQGPKDNTTNHVDEIDGGEKSRVNVGNTYGGKGFWD
ncbi:hypothetical protein LB507_004343 [Fusarium sp. FIESC RH6]|nr:hypothetical protein LB507_004343 [Fusarium sp. FIESC RH6]